MPAFFRTAGAQLAYLNPEPDRWRAADQVEMGEAWAYDHFINLERVPPGVLAAPDRFSYLAALAASGADAPHRVGLLPFRIVELYQRLVAQWRLWRQERDPVRRGWIEQRILNDAGILGHYVTDASQPHHTTIHYSGWADGLPNPQGFTLDRGFHVRFERDFVDAWVQPENVARRVARPPRSVAGRIREAVVEHIGTAHEQVERLYRLERDHGFDPRRAPVPEALDFAAERIAAGARMLADLWWSAWLESAM
jgi:hypothetical protein